MTAFTKQTLRPNPEAKKIERLTYFEAIEKRLGVMDTTALSLCMDNDVPIVVFDLFNGGNLRRIVEGEDIGSVVSADGRSLGVGN